MCPTDMTLRVAASAAAALFLHACAGSSLPVENASATKETTDLAAQFEREADDLVAHPIALGALTGEVLATGQPVVTPAEDYVQLEVPFADSKYECFAYPEAKDAADVLRLLAEATLGDAAPEHEWVDVRGGAAEGWGYLLSRARYTTDSAEGKLLGDFKIAVSVRGESTVACMFDSPGFYRSFEHSLTHMLGSFGTPPHRDGTAPREVRVTRTRIDGRMVNLSRNVRTDGKGRHATVVQSIDASLSIGQGGELRTQDSARVEHFRRGRLAEGHYVRFTSGEPDYEIKLRSRGNTYLVSGTMQGKPIKSRFKVKGGLGDSKRANKKLCAVVGGRAESVSIAGYTPSTDPERPVETLAVRSPEPGADVKLTLGQEAGPEVFAKLEADTCEMKTAQIKVGPLSMEMERLWIERSGA